MGGPRGEGGGFWGAAEAVDGAFWVQALLWEGEAAEAQNSQQARLDAGQKVELAAAMQSCPDDCIRGLYVAT